MILIVCLDDRNGLAFNKRRLSMDKLLRQRILDRCDGQKLWMNAYTAGQFSPIPVNVQVCPDYLEKAGDKDFCFLETGNIMPYRHKLSGLIVYYWNRTYPFDQTFPLKAIIGNAVPLSSIDFTGNSHQRITEVVYAFS